LSRQAEASLAVNHGGVAIVAAAGVKLTSINTGVKPSTFSALPRVLRQVRRPTLSC